MIMEIHVEKASEIDSLNNFYSITNYGGKVSGDDRVAYITAEDRIIGVGRLSEENGVYVLRGMRVMKEYRQHGLGKTILDSLLNEICKNECYCIPFRILRHFYAAKGFKEIRPSEAPTFLRVRLSDYKTQDLDVIIMKNEL